MTPNLKAFLDMLGWAEGTTTVFGSDDGYNVLVGSTLFHSYADHPNVLVKLSSTLSSTAAGRYQLLYRWWLPYKAMLQLTDFSPASQDAVAIQQIRERRALPDIAVGNVAAAIAKCSNIWASLPGNGYGQQQRPLAELLRHFVAAGGTLASQLAGVAS